MFTLQYQENKNSVYKIDKQKKNGVLNTVAIIYKIIKIIDKIKIFNFYIHTHRERSEKNCTLKRLKSLKNVGSNRVLT